MLDCAARRERVAQPRDVMARFEVFILAKNEERNLARCLEPLSRHGIPTIVLDSGSTDRTREVAASFPNVSIEAFRYKNHLASYDEITTTRLPPNGYGLILDADMVITEALFPELANTVESGRAEVGIAPVTMYWLGKLLPHGSLYPPKPILFRGGRSYFQPAGHGEQLVPELRTILFEAPILHDDRKGFAAFVSSQIRYSRVFAARAQGGDLTWRDRVRLRSPAMAVVAPLVSLLFRGGLLAGRVGFVYALDKLIAEIILFRAVVVSRITGADDGA
jgi:glycosyltransferase involved in cell wall biosynthesis